MKLQSEFGLFGFLDFPKQTYKHSQKPISLNTVQSTASILYVREMEITRKRNKFKKPCYDGQNYDFSLWEQLLQNVGCRPFSKAGNAWNRCTKNTELKRMY